MDFFQLFFAILVGVIGNAVFFRYLKKNNKVAFLASVVSLTGYTGSVVLIFSEIWIAN